MRRRPSVLLSLGTALASLAALAACTSTPPRATSLPGSVATASATRTPVATAPPRSPAPSTSPAPTTDPLTGRPRQAAGRLVAVKIDNERLAQPFQRGIDRAALVYQELMEGGSTRLLAVFESGLAGDGEVGPVRSLRESDIELLRQFGRVTVGFSGANAGVKDTFHRAVTRGYVLDGSYDVLPQDYRQGSRRPDAYNFFVHVDRLATHRPQAGAPADIGLRFGRAPAGPATLRATVSFSPDWTVELRYDPATRRYAVRQNGRLMAGVAPANVVVQSVSEQGSRYRDVLGAPTPYTRTLGSGRAVVLRDGRRVVGRWARTGYGATHVLDGAGRDVPLLPGQTWVLLLPTGRSPTFG